MKRSRLIIFLILFTCIVFGLFFARTAYKYKFFSREPYLQKKIRILTYSTFVGSSGPGTELLDAFQAATGAKVEILTAGDAGLLLERLKLAQASGSPFDVVLGLDQLMIDDAAKDFQWKKLQLSKDSWRPEVAAKHKEDFAPFDWSPLTFVYREGSVTPPKTFDALASESYRNTFAIQDPRSSSPGLQFFEWVKAVKGKDTAAFLGEFKPNVQSIAPSWSFSYGLFKKNQAQFVFTYVTSLAFHWGVEKDRQYAVVNLPEGHPVQIEYAGIPADCRECELADQFVKHLLTPEMQKIIMQKNFMFPVLRDLEAGTVFAELPKLKTIETSTGKDLSEWDQVFKR